MSQDSKLPSFGMFVECEPGPSGEGRRVRCYLRFDRWQGPGRFVEVYSPERYETQGNITTSTAVSGHVCAYVVENNVKRYSTKRHNEHALNMLPSRANEAARACGWAVK